MTFITFASLAVFVSLLIAQPATSHELKRGYAGCEISVSGKIELGLSKDLEKQFERRPFSILCLDSKGGDYDEGLKTIDFLIEKAIATYLPKNADCYSACSLIFLAGNKREHDPIFGVAVRTMHKSARLGLHAPYQENQLGVSLEDGPNARIVRQLGIRAIGQLIARGNQNLFPVSLLQKALKFGPNDFYQIDTIDKVGRWKIKLSGVSEEYPITNANLHNLCSNRQLWDTNRYATFLWNNYLQPSFSAQIHRQVRRIAFPRFGAEGSAHCVVDIINFKGATYLRDYLVDNPSTEMLHEVPGYFQLISQRKLDNFTPLYYLRQASVKLSDL